MVDSSWDNQGGPPPKAGMGTGAKVALGCGVALVLGIGGCVAGGIFIARHSLQRPEVREDMARALAPMIRSIATSLLEDGEAGALYRNQPGLREQFPDEAAFLAATRPWRPALAQLPDGNPKGDDFRMDISFLGNSAMSLRLPDGRWFRVTLKRGRRHRKATPGDLPIARLDIIQEQP